ncbi:MAG: DUF3568 domain-containing protein [Puniceicoccales bacterium]|jgi:hypothetical protein|nr:DUF3568 domain-containing protein [Puniceicoccales bacterium]
MKKLLSLAMLTALVAFPLSGCITQVGVNAKNSTADWNSMSGSLTVKYTDNTIEDVFVATKKGLDQLQFFRTGETLPKDGKSGSITVYARAIGDMNITVDIYTAKNTKTKKEWTQAVIKYGTWGNLQESQKIVSAISENLH